MVMLKLSTATHAMNAVDEMRALNTDVKKIMDKNGAEYPVWRVKTLENTVYMLGRYAYAGVAHPNEGAAARRAYGHLNAAVFAVVFYRVIAKVVNHFKNKRFSAVYKGALTLCRYGYFRFLCYARNALYRVVCNL